MLYAVTDKSKQSVKPEHVIRHRHLDVCGAHKSCPELTKFKDTNDTKTTTYLGFLDPQYGLVGSARSMKLSEVKLRHSIKLPKDLDPKTLIIMDNLFYIPQSSALFTMNANLARSHYMSLCRRFYDSLLSYMETVAITKAVKSFALLLDEEAWQYLQYSSNQTFKLIKTIPQKSDGSNLYFGIVDTASLVRSSKPNMGLIN